MNPSKVLKVLTALTSAATALSTALVKLTDRVPMYHGLRLWAFLVSLIGCIAAFLFLLTGLPEGDKISRARKKKAQWQMIASFAGAVLAVIAYMAFIKVYLSADVLGSLVTVFLCLSFFVLMTLGLGNGALLVAGRFPKSAPGDE